MPKQNFETFRSLLRGAICTRTQAQFANESGISAEHLNRMLNADTIHRPSKSTLRKIAAVAKNGITYQMMLDALNEDEPNSISPEDQAQRAAEAAEDFRDFPEDAKSVMSALCDAIKIQPYPVMADSLADHMETLIASAYKNFPSPAAPVLSYELGIDRGYFGKKFSCAAKYVRVFLSMADSVYAAESDLLLYFTEIPSQNNGVKYAIQAASCAVADIFELYGMPPAAMKAHESEEDEGKAIDAAMEDPFYLEIQEVELFEEEEPKLPSNASVEQRLLHAILGGQRARFPVTTEGIGFSLNETPPNLMDFFLAHRKAVLSPYKSEPENYDDVSAAMDVMVQAKELQPFLDKLDSQNYCDEAINNDLGWPAAIAVVMSEETGFPFLFKKKSEDPDGKIPWLSKNNVIILSDADAEKNGIQREAILLAACRYARELGLTKFGDLLFTNMQFSKHSQKMYIVNNSPKRDRAEDEYEKADEAYSMRFEDQPYPGETGLYAVKLKDGRKMRIVFLSGPNAWVMCHKEWSDLIECYCPEPLPLPKKEK